MLQHEVPLLGFKSKITCFHFSGSQSVHNAFFWLHSYCQKLCFIKGNSRTKFTTRDSCSHCSCHIMLIPTGLFFKHDKIWSAVSIKPSPSCQMRQLKSPCTLPLQHSALVLCFILKMRPPWRLASEFRSTVRTSLPTFTSWASVSLRASKPLFHVKSRG